MHTTRNTLFSLGLILAITLGITSCSNQPKNEGQSSEAQQALGSGTLRVVTWNVEHLAFPITDGCRSRTKAEIRALRSYAQDLEADIVALQEVGSIEALGQVFPPSDWQLFLSQRPDSETYECRESGRQSTQQKVAFAVQNDIEVLGETDFTALGLDNPGLRHGMELTVSTPLGEMDILNVHMKSGCFKDDFSRSDSEACQTFARQAPILDDWIEAKEREKTPYLVVGDFNHRLSSPYNKLSMLMADNSNGAKSNLVNATASLIGCHPYYPAPIDHILMGQLQSPALTTSPRVHSYDDMNPDNMLSDHCAVSLTLENGQLPLSTSVTWQTTSKEYRYLTTSTYHRASEYLKSASLPTTPWMVTMDIDETVLDNSDYQVILDRSGRTYTSESWAKWVASEQARLVPGVGSFIETVIGLGGHVGFITNRNRVQDHHTWSNMIALGLPLTTTNSCLMGRSSKDVSSVNGGNIINDKDLRREQLENGTSSCYQAENERHNSFPGATIVMQVGDNIEDFAGVTQETASLEALLASTETTYILLPNPMYVSW